MTNIANKNKPNQSLLGKFPLNPGRFRPRQQKINSKNGAEGYQLMKSLKEQLKLT